MSGNAAAAALSTGGPEIIRIDVAEAGIELEEFLPNSLPPDVAYCLDAEQEFGGIAADDRAFVDLFDEGTVEWFDAISDSAARFPDEIKRRHAAWRATASLQDRVALDWAGMRGLRWLFDGMVADVALAVARDLPADAVAPYVSEAAIRTHIRSSADVARFVACAAPVVARAVEDAGLVGPEAFLADREGVERLYAAARARLEARNRAMQAVADSRPRRMAGAEPGMRPSDALAKPVETVKERREKRKVLSRSFHFLEGLVGRPKAKAWLSGDEVAVSGRDFDFRLRVADVHRSSFHAVDVFVTDKAGVELAKLCVYAKDTPALDQVASLVLHVVSGEEGEIVKTANIISSTVAAEGNAAFARLRASRPAREIVDIGLPGERRRPAMVPAVAIALAEHLEATVWRPLTEMFGDAVSWTGSLGVSAAPWAAGEETGIAEFPEMPQLLPMSG